MRSATAISSLFNIVTSDEPPSLKKWCIYALSQIGDKRARSHLNQLRARHLKGVAARELKLALHRF